MKNKRKVALTVTRCMMRGYTYDAIESRGPHNEITNCGLISIQLNIHFTPEDFVLTNQGELHMTDNTKLDLEEQRAAALSMYVAILMAAGKPTSDVSIDFLKTYEDAEILALVVEKMHEVLAKVVEHKSGG